MKAPETSKQKLPGSKPSVLQDPNGARRFSAPEDILIDRALGRREQFRLLDDWKLELEQLATATDENVPNCVTRTQRVQPEELLRRVNACRRLLGEQEH